MKSVLIAVTILAMLCTVFTTLSALVFCMSMGANAKPPEIKALKLWMLGFSLLGLAGLIVGGYFLKLGQPGWAASISFSPAALAMVIFIVSLLK